MIKVKCEVNTYDKPKKPLVLVRSHWNRNSMIVIEIGDIEVTVIAEDLKAAIDNATNTKRF